MTTKRPTHYHIFVLTLWLEDEAELADPEKWRFRLEEPKTSQRHGCVGLSNLTDYLISEVSDLDSDTSDSAAR